MQRTQLTFCTAAVVAMLTGPSVATPPSRSTSTAVVARADINKEETRPAPASSPNFPCRCPKCVLCRSVADRSFDVLTKEVEGPAILPDGTDPGTCPF